MGNYKEQLIDELSQKYDKEKVVNEASKYDKYFSIIENKTIERIVLLVSYVAFLLSFKYELIVFGDNVLRVLPLMLFAMELTDKVINDKILKNKYWFAAILLLSIINLKILQILNINQIVGFGIVSQIIFKKSALRKRVK